MKEVFSTRPVSKQFKKFAEKEKKDYNAKDMGFYFMLEYEKKFDIPYGRVYGREGRHLKDLILDYEPENVVKGIDYLLKHYKKFIGKDYPTIGVLFGFRHSIFPQILEKGGKNNVLA